jgi:SHS2 domain-containing protein
MELPVYKITIDDTTESGMKAMSIVSKGAIESDFIRLNSNKRPNKVVALVNEDKTYKQILAGLALIPNKYIYRNYEGFEYMVYFEATEIEKIRNKFHKEGLTSIVNLQHDSENPVNAYLIESYIINTEERLAEVKSQGIEEAVIGSWYVAYKVDDADAFNLALSGEFNGFSIEIMGNLELETILSLSKNKFKNNNKNNLIMSKFNSLINKFKQVLESFEYTESTIADTETKVSYGEVGEAVYTIEIAEDGTETQVTLGEGTYVLSNGKTIVVDTNGNLVEVKDEEVPSPAITEEDLEEVVAPIVETPIVETNPTVTVIDAITQLVPKDANGQIMDGSYSVEVYVNNGVVTYGTMYAYTYKDLEFSQNKVKELESEVAKLSKQPANIPLSIVETKPTLTAQDLKKMNNLELQLYKLGLK